MVEKVCYRIFRTKSSRVYVSCDRTAAGRATEEVMMPTVLLAILLAFQADSNVPLARIISVDSGAGTTKVVVTLKVESGALFSHTEVELLTASNRRVAATLDAPSGLHFYLLAVPMSRTFLLFSLLDWRCTAS
jgi:hypothetical protein